jgi:hypothetical protein
VVDLAAPASHVSAAVGGLGWVPSYGVCGQVTMTNSGNVAIHAWFADDDTPDTWETFIDVTPGAQIAVPFPPAGTRVFMGLDGSNTIADPVKFQIGNDGNAYLQLTSGCP